MDAVRGLRPQLWLSGLAGQGCRFAIEFARRGYVVLALDQTGHGYSGGAAFSNGFGGPDGLDVVRRLLPAAPSTAAVATTAV